MTHCSWRAAVPPRWRRVGWRRPSSATSVLGFPQGVAVKPNRWCRLGCAVPRRTNRGDPQAGGHGDGGRSGSPDQDHSPPPCPTNRASSCCIHSLFSCSQASGTAGGRVALREIRMGSRGRIAAAQAAGRPRPGDPAYRGGRADGAFGVELVARSSPTEEPGPSRGPRKRTPYRRQTRAHQSSWLCPVLRLTRRARLPNERDGLGRWRPHVCVSCTQDVFWFCVESWSGALGTRSSVRSEICRWPEDAIAVSVIHPNLCWECSRTRTSAHPSDSHYPLRSRESSRVLGAAHSRLLVGVVVGVSATCGGYEVATALCVFVLVREARLGREQFVDRRRIALPRRPQLTAFCDWLRFASWTGRGEQPRPADLPRTGAVPCSQLHETAM